MTTLAEIAPWRLHRKAMGNQTANDPAHNVAHIAKALGPLAGMAEHWDHDEPLGTVDPKRAADLVIHAVWLCEILGFDVDRLVAERMAGFRDGFKPQQSKEVKNGT